MSFFYFQNPETAEVFAYDQQQIDDDWVEPGLVQLTDEEVKLHLNPPVTRDQLIAEAEQERERLLAYADSVMLDWRTELMLGEISDDDKARLAEWMAYKRDVKAVPAEVAIAPEFNWPPQPL